MGSTWAWRKSSASGGASDDCVEIAWTGETVLIRDSARPRGAVLAVDPAAWTAFVSWGPAHPMAVAAEPGVLRMLGA
ncbi:DUF397 domain-containing protein [Streptomyces sp. NPDC005863]|uniref:DUF397 domain-containing protein n=1 Tax=unclassified Streptomyces TaxID=2593676 RepID=UPI0033E8D03B